MQFIMEAAPANLAAVTTSSRHDTQHQDDPYLHTMWALLDSGGKAMFTRRADWGECCAKQSARHFSLNLLFAEEAQCE